MAFYALMHRSYPVERALSVFEGTERPCISVLWGTFGRRKEGLIKFISRHHDRDHLLQIHLMNHVAVRNGNARKGELFRGRDIGGWNKALVERDSRTKQKVQARVRAIRGFLEAHRSTHTQLILSVALEDNLSPMAARVLVEWVREEWPYEVSRNPVFGDNKATADYIEHHGVSFSFDNTKPHIVAMDGVDLIFPHRRATVIPAIDEKGAAVFLQRAQARGSFAVFLWRGDSQGLKGSTLTTPPPKRRKFKFTNKDASVIQRLLTNLQ